MGFSHVVAFWCVSLSWCGMPLQVSLSPAFTAGQPHLPHRLFTRLMSLGTGLWSKFANLEGTFLF